jgi:hypothetical protein
MPAAVRRHRLAPAGRASEAGRALPDQLHLAALRPATLGLAPGGERIIPRGNFGVLVSLCPFSG